MIDKPPLEVIDILTIAISSGMLGGVVAAFAKIAVEENIILFSGKPAFLRPFFVFLFASVISGAGSAVGLLFALHFLQLLKPDRTVENQLFLISACLIAGIAALRLIPRYTHS